MSELLTLIPSELSGGSAYHLLNGIIAPRPISWISTVAPDGTYNLAPHSYTTVAAPDPPTVLFVSIGRKDTLRNIEANGEFVYNVGGANLVERINRTSADFPPDISEFDWAGLTPIPSDQIRPPRVAEAPVQMECRLETIHKVGNTSNFLVLGQVIAFHLDEDILVNGRVDTSRLAPAGRLAGALYAHMGDVFSLDRPTWRGLMEEGAEPFPKSGSG